MTQLVRRAFEEIAAPVACLWRSRQLVYYLTRQRIVTRYRGSLLGVLWSILSPGVTLAIFTFVFGYMLQPRWSPESTDTTEFALLLYLGLCVFWFVSECVSEAPNLVLGHAAYVKKVVFPLEILPWVSVAHALFHSVIRFAVFAAALALLGPALPWTIVLLPLVWLPICLSTLGVCWLVAAAGVFFRDLGELIGLFLTALMFMSPILYPLSSIPEAFRFVMLANPITLPVVQVRDVAYFGRLADPGSFAVLLAISYALAWLGRKAFARARGAFADVV